MAVLTSQEKTNILQAMEDLDSLIVSWGVKRENYFFMDRPGLHLIDCPVDLNDRGRMDFCIATHEQTLPWFNSKSENGFQEVPPPSSSDYLKQVNELIAKHDLEVHFYSFSEPKYRWRQEFLGKVILPNGVVARVNGVYGTIRGIGEDLLPLCTDEGLGYQKGIRMLDFIENMRELSVKQGNAKAAQKADEVLAKFAWLRTVNDQTINSLSEVMAIGGNSVVKGRIQGRAWVVKDILKDIPREPVVIITEKVTPAFYRYKDFMKALVVDHGGLTSHAAILAREFKIPSIVNTKVAMKKIKTGDLVEVDADKGFVKILSTNN